MSRAPRCELRTMLRTLTARGLAPAEVARLGMALEALYARCEADSSVAPFHHVLLDAEVVGDGSGNDARLAAVLVVEIGPSGARTILAADVGPSEDPAYWLGFLRRLLGRGLGDLPLVAATAEWPLATVLGALPAQPDAPAPPGPAAS